MDTGDIVTEIYLDYQQLTHRPQLKVTQCDFSNDIGYRRGYVNTVVIGHHAGAARGFDQKTAMTDIK